MTILRMGLAGSLILFSTLFVWSCSGHGEMNEIGTVNSRMRTLNEEHHEAVTSATNADAIREETARYETEMEQSLSEMETICADMMGGHQGMMGTTDVSGLCGMQSSMMDSMTDHLDTTAAMGDVEAMQSECDGHFANMADMLDQMQGMMDGQGMM